MEFNSLPLEVQLEIFSHLPFCDVMSIRRVCKLWNFLINSEFKFKQLRCYQLSTSAASNHQYEGFVFTFTRPFVDYTSTDPKFSRINYLFADLVPKKTSELQDAFDFLNSFKSLEEISFRCYPFRLNAVEGVQKQFVVSLPRLEKADFYFGNAIREANASVLLDLPSLLCLSTNSLSGITVGYPEKLRTLVNRTLFGGRQDYSLFTSLTNIFTNRRSVPSISASFFEKLPSLKELHVNFYGRLPRNYRIPEPSLSKASPKIFFFGFEFNAREIESEGAQWPNSISSDSTGDSARFIIRNLHRSVDSNPHVQSIDYNLIADELEDSQMFGVIPQKFPNIDHLRIIGTVVDENRLFKFIDKFKVLSFDFKRTSLSQRFFEQLAENHPFISRLEINEPTMSDFDFCFNFKNLKLLYFPDCPLSLNFVARALKEFKSFYSLTFQQPGSYRFSLSHCTPSSSPNLICVYLEVYAPRLNYLEYEIPIEGAPGLMNALQRQLNVDGTVCCRELQTLLSHLKFEEENTLFWMRNYLYDQRHSICLSEKQMIRLLNFRH